VKKVARPSPSASAAKRPDDRRGWYGQIENRHSLKMVEMLKAVRKERQRQAKTTPPQHPGRPSAGRRPPAGHRWALRRGQEGVYSLVHRWGFLHFEGWRDFCPFCPLAE
jgi:hypothetical protein